MSYKRGGKYKNEVYGRYTRLFMGIIIISNTIFFVNNAIEPESLQTVTEFLFLALISTTPITFAIKIILRAYGYLPPRPPREFDEFEEDFDEDIEDFDEYTED